MTFAHSPLRLNAFGSEAPASLRAALSSANRHQPNAKELAQLALALSPVLNAQPLPNGGASTAARAAEPPAAPRVSEARWSGVGWSVGKGAVFLATTAALLLGLPRIWLATHPDDGSSAGVLAMSSPIEPPSPPALAVAPPPSPEVEPASPASVAQRVAAPSRERGKPRITSSVPAAAAQEKESEVQLLERARRLLQSNPRQTLELVREHERRFSSGILVQEREILAIDALGRLGKGDEARSRDEGFRARFPASVHGKTVEVFSGRP